MRPRPFCKCLTTSRATGSGYAEENYEWVYPSVMLGHLPPAGSATAAKVTHVGCSIGDYVTANLYFPTAHGDEPLKGAS